MLTGALGSLLQAGAFGEVVQGSLALGVAVYLADKAIAANRHVKGKSNGGTYDDKVLMKLDKIAVNTHTSRERLDELRRENREAHSAATASQAAVASTISTLGSAIERNVTAVNGQNKILERVLEESFRRERERKGER